MQLKSAVKAPRLYVALSVYKIGISSLDFCAHCQFILGLCKSF